MNYYDRKELSQSDIKLLNKSILHYKSKGIMPCSDAMNVGKAFHTFVLEKDKFESEFAIKTINLATKEGKEWKATVNDKIIIDVKEFDWFNLMRKRIFEHPLSFILNNIEVESEILFEFQDVKCKSKLDAVNHDLKVIIDLKTIADCGKAENEVKYNYNVQAAFYRQAIFEVTNEWYDFIFIFAEKSFPHGVIFIKSSMNTFETGMEKVLSGIDIYKQLQSNPEIFSGYSQDFIEV